MVCPLEMTSTSKHSARQALNPNFLELNFNSNLNNLKSLKFLFHYVLLFILCHMIKACIILSLLTYIIAKKRPRVPLDNILLQKMEDFGKFHPPACLFQPTCLFHTLEQTPQKVSLGGSLFKYFPGGFVWSNLFGPGQGGVKRRIFLAIDGVFQNCFSI